MSVMSVAAATVLQGCNLPSALPDASWLHCCAATGRHTARPTRPLDCSGHFKNFCLPDVGSLTVEWTSADKRGNLPSPPTPSHITPPTAPPPGTPLTS
jgi:hypothetical protein